MNTQRGGGVDAEESVTFRRLSAFRGNYRRDMTRRETFETKRKERSCLRKRCYVFHDKSAICQRQLACMTETRTAVE